MPSGADHCASGSVDAAAVSPPRFGLLSAALATNEALDFGLVPQWRSRIENTASRRTAARLGFVEVGSQTTVLLAAAPA